MDLPSEEPVTTKPTTATTEVKRTSGLGSLMPKPAVKTEKTEKPSDLKSSATKLHSENGRVHAKDTQSKLDFKPSEKEKVKVEKVPHVSELIEGETAVKLKNKNHMDTEEDHETEVDQDKQYAKDVAGLSAEERAQEEAFLAPEGHVPDGEADEEEEEDEQPKKKKKSKNKVKQEEDENEASGDEADEVDPDKTEEELQAAEEKEAEEAKEAIKKKSKAKTKTATRRGYL